MNSRKSMIIVALWYAIMAASPKSLDYIVYHQPVRGQETAKSRTLRVESLWQSTDLDILITPNDFFVIDLIDATLFRQLNQDPHAKLIRELFPAFRWTQWRHWERIMAENNGDTTAITFDHDGRLLEYSFGQCRKHSFRYDNSGDLASWQTTAKDEAGVWVDDRRYQLSYDDSHRIVEIIFDVWSSTTGAWDRYLKNSCRYDSDGNLVETGLSCWNYGTLQWDNLSRVLHTIDEHNRITESSFFVWQSSSDGWLVGDLRETFGYDDAGLLTYRRTYARDTDKAQTWIASEQTLYRYAPDGLPVSELLQLWDLGNGVWRNLLMTQTLRDRTPQSRQTILSRFDNAALTWNYESRIEELFDGDRQGAISEKTLAFWDSALKSWGLAQKFVYTYGTDELPDRVAEFLPDKKGPYWALAATYKISVIPKSGIIKKKIVRNPMSHTITLKNGLLTVVLPGKTIPGTTLAIFAPNGRKIGVCHGSIRGSETIFSLSTHGTMTPGIYLMAILQQGGMKPVSSILIP